MCLCVVISAPAVCLKFNMTGRISTQYKASVTINPREQLSIQAEATDTSEVNIARKGLRAFVIAEGGPTSLLSGFGMSVVKRRSAPPFAQLMSRHD